MSTEQPTISFPSGVVGATPLRIPVLWSGETGIALDKPPGLAAFQDTRVGGGPNSLLTEINRRASAGAAQFERLGIRTLFSVNLLDREASGIVLFAKDETGRASLKNAMGSSQFCFRYRFLTAADPDEEEISCELPLAVHREKPLALVSHRTGKKTVTRFRRVDRLRIGALWESESAYDRYHQVRLHAAESGLPMLGETLYSNARKAAEVKVNASAEELTASAGFFLHLFSLRFPAENGRVEVEAPYPRPLAALLKKLRRE